jgi:hypothetical protein
MSLLVCVLIYVYIIAVGVYFCQRILSAVLGFAITEFIVYHSRCNRDYPAGLFVNIGMKIVLLATSHVIWFLLCLVYLISTVVRSGYEMGRYHLEKITKLTLKTKPYSKGKR